MKKVIGLFLVLILSFNISAFAGTLNDGEIEHLKGLKIMVGDPDGSLRTDEFTTVGEAAKMICVTMGISDVSQNLLPEGYPLGYDHWASKYIYYTDLMQMLTLPESAENYPDSFITGGELIKMLVTVLGYADAGSNLEMAEYLKKGAELGITKGVSLIADDKITRGDAGKLISNALDVPIMAMLGYDVENGGKYVILNGKNGTELDTLNMRLTK